MTNPRRLSPWYLGDPRVTSRPSAVQVLVPQTTPAPRLPARKPLRRVVDVLSGTPAHARRCGPCGEPAAGRCWQTPNVASPACAPRCRRSSAPPPELGPPSPSACSPSPRARLRPRGGPGRDLGSLRRGQGRRRCQGSRFRFSCLSRCGRLRARRRCPPHRSHGRARSGMLDLSPPTEALHKNSRFERTFCARGHSAQKVGGADKWTTAHFPLMATR
jgi:hypothetical protein